MTTTTAAAVATNGRGEGEQHEREPSAAKRMASGQNLDERPRLSGPVEKWLVYR